MQCQPDVALSFSQLLPDPTRDEYLLAQALSGRHHAVPSDYALDIAATLAHLDVLVEAGVHGLILLGTVGENCSLEPAEKLDLLRAAVGACRRSRARGHRGGRIHHRPGLPLRRRRGALGVDGLMVLPGMVYKSDASETVAHFRAIAQASALPILCYNNPVAYGVDITPAMFAELADEPTLVAIKESSENVRRVTDLRNLLGDRYRILCGVDDLFLESMLLGAEGWVSGLVNAFPAENRWLWDLVEEGRLGRGSRALSLVHAAVASRHAAETGAMHQAGDGPSRAGQRNRPSAAAAAGRRRARAEVLAIIRQAISSRPEAIAAR